MSVTFKFDEGRKLGKTFKNRVKRFSEKQTKAVQATAQRAKDEILAEGRANIAAGGNFSSDRWQMGFQVKLSYQSRTDITLRVTHSVFYWRVFEYGAVIRGRPMLWIPLSFATDAQGVMARDYPYYMFRVDRVGKAPLLMTHDGEAKYFGKESVTIPKKWTLRQVVRNVSYEMPRYYREAMKNG